MPELPEMQALAERAHDAFAGARIASVTPFAFSSLKTVQPAYDSIVGQVVERVWRRGKFLVLDLDDARMLVHLSQGGRVDFEDPPKSTKPKFAVVRFSFEQAPSVLVKEFGTERKAGWWVLAPDDEGPLARLGPEPFDDAFADWLTTSDDKRRIHTALRDQHTVAGIGRGYTDDALWRARLSPYASVASLDADARTHLLDAIRTVLTEALAGERERAGGLPTKLGDRFRIHNHAGEPCPRCGGDLRRVSFESHEIVYCPACQTGGKVLADRRMSRLIR